MFGLFKKRFTKRPLSLREKLVEETSEEFVEKIENDIQEGMSNFEKEMKKEKRQNKLNAQRRLKTFTNKYNFCEGQIVYLRTDEDENIYNQCFLHEILDSGLEEISPLFGPTDYRCYVEAMIAFGTEFRRVKFNEHCGTVMVPKAVKKALLKK